MTGENELIQIALNDAMKRWQSSAALTVESD